MVRILKRDFALRRRAATQRQIAAGDENQIAIELAGVVHLAAAIDGSTEAVIGAQSIERRRGGKQLRGGGRDKQLLGISLQDNFAIA